MSNPLQIRSVYPWLSLLYHCLSINWWFCLLIVRGYIQRFLLDSFDFCLLKKPAPTHGCFIFCSNGFLLLCDYIICYLQPATAITTSPGVCVFQFAITLLTQHILKFETSEHQTLRVPSLQLTAKAPELSKIPGLSLPSLKLTVI